MTWRLWLQESVTSSLGGPRSTSGIASAAQLLAERTAESALLAEDKLSELKKHGLYHLHVCLRNGRELAAKDSCGTSDPYVKFYWRGKQVYKSKTILKDLNPVWDESFILAIDDPFIPLEMKVSMTSAWPRRPRGLAASWIFNLKKFCLLRNLELTRAASFFLVRCARQAILFDAYFNTT